MNKVKICTDSISDLSPELLKQHNIPVMPLMINLGETDEPDGEGMPEKIFAYVEKTGLLPKTAARGIETYVEFFNEHKPENGEIVHFCISSEMSTSYASACAAAEQVGGVHVVDTRSLSTGAGLNVLYACDLADENILSGAEIAEKCRSRADKAQASFVVDNLTYLHKGGRCSGVALLFSNILNIKPMIMLKDGKMVVGKKYIAKFDKAIDKYVNDIMNIYDTPDLKRLFITYTTAPDGMVERVKQAVLNRFPFENVYETNAGGTVTSHCGKNTLGILYFNDGEKKL